MIAATLAAARRFFTGLYFYPDADILGLPSAMNISYEEVRFRSGDDTLHGFLMRAKGTPRGAVLHCHGNAGNVTSHFPLVRFLVEGGYDVLTFDYAGFGRSTGRPTLDGIERNSRDALAWMLTRSDLAVDRLAVFGQSLGGAAAAAAAEHPAVRCLVLEATFTTYRDVAFTTLTGKSLFFIVPLVIPDGGPERHLPAVAPRPVFLVHGEADSVVPVRFSRRLHALFPENTELYVAPNIEHLSPGEDESTSFGDSILKFLEVKLARP